MELTTTLIDKVGTIKKWILRVFDSWGRLAQKEQKKKNKIPLKYSPLQIIKTLT